MCQIKWEGCWDLLGLHIINLFLCLCEPSFMPLKCFRKISWRKVRKNHNHQKMALKSVLETSKKENQMRNLRQWPKRNIFRESGVQARRVGSILEQTEDVIRSVRSRWKCRNSEKWRSDHLICIQITEHKNQNRVSLALWRFWSFSAEGVPINSKM